jgi:hypothetical protein
MARKFEAGLARGIETQRFPVVEEVRGPEMGEQALSRCYLAARCHLH